MNLFSQLLRSTFNMKGGNADGANIERTAAFVGFGMMFGGMYAYNRRASRFRFITGGFQEIMTAIGVCSRDGVLGFLVGGLSAAAIAEHEDPFLVLGAICGAAAAAVQA